MKFGWGKLWLRAGADQVFVNELLGIRVLIVYPGRVKAAAYEDLY